jgi:hypothetical protein
MKGAAKSKFALESLTSLGNLKSCGKRGWQAVKRISETNNNLSTTSGSSRRRASEP